jgi:hypothetical protein
VYRAAGKMAMPCAAREYFTFEKYEITDRKFNRSSDSHVASRIFVGYNKTNTCALKYFYRRTTLFYERYFHNSVPVMYKCISKTHLFAFHARPSSYTTPSQQITASILRK